MTTDNASTAAISTDLPSLLAHWQLAAIRPRPDIILPGSPDRTPSRLALESADGKLYVLEQLFPAKRGARRRQSALLQRLAEAGLPVHPWLLTSAGASCACTKDGGTWQLREYIPGVALDRPRYAQDAWRGEALGAFLVALRRQDTLAPLPVSEPFDLPRYVDGLIASYKVRRPELAEDLTPIRRELDAFWTAHAGLPFVFCHGDFHPLNVMWGDKAINSVIDWEFMGTKAQCYDVANFIGCVGMDDPAQLTGPLIMAMLSAIRRGGIWSADSWQWLPEFVAALRFAWLREWVIHEPLDTICQELDLIWLLLDNRELLRQRWQNPG